jgi:outer membrane protein OmpA-like peptidoglycan-associated protein
VKKEGRAPPALLALILGALSAGCVREATSKDLLHAEDAVERARRSPTAERAKLALYQAEVALAEAKREAEAGSRMAKAQAYVARRRAERASIEGLYAAEKEAIVMAHAAIARLRLNLERRADAAVEEDRRLEEEARRSEAARPALQRALEKARGGRGELTGDAEMIRLRLPSEILFESYMPVLQRGADRRLAAIAEAIRMGPPCAVWIRVLDDVDGLTMDRRLLSRRRAARIREALMEHGVPADYFFAHPEPAEGAVPAGTQVDLILVLQPGHVQSVR